MTAPTPDEACERDPHDWVDEHIRREVESWPPLTAEQRARLAVLLSPVPCAAQSAIEGAA